MLGYLSFASDPSGGSDPTSVSSRGKRSVSVVFLGGLFMELSNGLPSLSMGTGEKPAMPAIAGNNTVPE